MQPPDVEPPSRGRRPRTAAVGERLGGPAPDLDTPDAREIQDDLVWQALRRSWWRFRAIGIELPPQRGVILFQGGRND